MNKTTEKLKQSAKCLSPIPSIKYIHDCMDSSKKIKVVLDGRNTDRAPFRLLQNAINTVDLTSQSTKRRLFTQISSKKTLPSLSNTLPAPKDKNTYGKNEVVDIIKKYPSHSLSRSSVIKIILENKLVNCKSTTLYDLLKKDKKIFHLITTGFHLVNQVFSPAEMLSPLLIS